MSNVFESDCGNVTTLAGDEIPNTVILTEDAEDKVADLLLLEGPDTFLRVAVQSGGCSGFQYYFGFDTVVEEDDIVTEFDGGRVVVDSTSMEYMKGSTIGYEKSIMAEHFKVTNHLATSECGCGTSFHI